MNPFDLSGPSFLVFYIVFAVVVVVAVKLAIDTAEQGAPPALPLSDPYQIAWLRGGTPEAARIAVLALTDRGLLAMQGDDLVNFGPARSFVQEPLERAILALCAQSGTAATAVLDDPAVEQACAVYQAQLERLQLMPDPAMRARPQPLAGHSDRNSARRRRDQDRYRDRARQVQCGIRYHPRADCTLGDVAAHASPSYQPRQPNGQRSPPALQNTAP